MSSRRVVPLAALVAAALFVVAFATSLVPWLTRERMFVTSTPTTLSVAELTDVRMAPRSLLCVDDLGLEPSAGGLQVIVKDVAKAGSTPPLSLELRAGGYRSTTRLAGGYPSDVPVTLPVDAPPRELDGARACIRNEGRKAIALVGTAVARELARVEVQVDGKTVTPQPWLQFVQRSPASILERPGEILDRVAAFRPFPAVPVLLGLLALLVLAGVPLAVIGALALAERSDGEDRA